MCLKVQLVSGEPQLLAALRSLLERESDFVVVSEAGSAVEATRAAAMVRPDVVIIDAELHDALVVARTLRRRRQRQRIMMLSGQPTADAASSALSAGATGFVSKVQPPRVLIGAVRAIGRGGSYVCPTW